MIVMLAYCEADAVTMFWCIIGVHGLCWGLLPWPIEHGHTLRKKYMDLMSQNAYTNCFYINIFTFLLAERKDWQMEIIPESHNYTEVLVSGSICTMIIQFEFPRSSRSFEGDKWNVFINFVSNFIYFTTYIIVILHFNTSAGVGLKKGVNLDTVGHLYTW